MTQLIFQYFSDIHLEFYNKNKFFDIKKSADILFIAGDIGIPTSSNYVNFLEQMSSKFEKVFFTTGNHEYYKSSNMNNIDNICREIYRQMPQQNIHFLQNDVYNLTDNINIFGGTFWTNIPNNESQYISSAISDYKYITNFTTDKSNELHKIAVEKLENCINNTNKKWIVMSHHMPLLKLIAPRYKVYNKINCAFASDINIANHPNILTWIYGHTHQPSINEKFICNPIGYPNENIHINFNKIHTINI